MAIQVYCNCGNPLIVPAELSGHKVKCKVCQTVLRIPDLPSGAKATDDDEAGKLAQSGDYEVVAEDTIQLSCPSCGALAAPEDTACLSCGAELGGGGGKSGVPIPKLSGIPKVAKLAIAGLVALLVLGGVGFKVYEATRPSALASAGFEALASRDYAGARAAFGESLEYEPNYPQAVIGMAELAVAQNRVGDIRRYAPNAIKHLEDKRRRGALRLALARTDLDEERYREAYNGAIEAKDDDPNLSGIDSVRGLAMLGLDQREEALEVLQIAARDRADDYRVYHRLSQLLREKKELKAAQGNAEQAVKLKEDDPGLWLLLSELRELNGDSDGAKVALEKVVELEPENAAAHSRLSGLHLADGDYDKALAASKQAQQLAPENVEVQLSVGRILLAQGKPKEAKVELIRAIKVTKTWEAEYLLGQALLQLKENKEALRWLGAALKKRPQDQALHLEAAGLALEAGLGADAVPWMRVVLKLNEENYDARLMTARCLASADRRKHHAEIVEHLERALQLEPERGSAALELGQHHLDRLDPEAAIAAFDKGLDASSSDKELLYWKGRACVRCKRWDDAVKTLEHLKRISPNYKDVDVWLRRAEEGRFYNE